MIGRIIKHGKDVQVTFSESDTAILFHDVDT